MTLFGVDSLFHVPSQECQEKIWPFLLFALKITIVIAAFYLVSGRR